MFLRMLLVLLILAFCPAPAQADDLEDGRAAIGAGDYATALRLLKPLAEQGNADAQSALGFLYKQGWGVKQDYDEARRWLQKAADQGHSKAQINLGRLYDEGLGVPRDYTEAARWYRMAAERGDQVGQGLLGAMYAMGQGVEQDYFLAISWYRKSAEQGNAEAQYRLGLMHEEGQGVAPDNAEAEKGYRMAAEQGHLGAKARLDALLARSARPGGSVEPTISQALAAPAIDLAQSYLSAKFMTQMFHLVKGGGAIQIGGQETITKSNVEEYQRRYEQRLSTYREAIKQRGHKTVSGAYRGKTTEACARIRSAWVGSIREGRASGIEITQDGFDAQVIVSIEHEGKRLSLRNRAAIAESGIALQDEMNSDYFFVGWIKDKEIELKPSLSVLRSWPQWAGPPSREALENCTITLEPLSEDFGKEQR